MHNPSYFVSSYSILMPQKKNIPKQKPLLPDIFVSGSRVVPQPKSHAQRKKSPVKLPPVKSKPSLSHYLMTPRFVVAKPISHRSPTTRLGSRLIPMTPHSTGSGDVTVPNLVASFSRLPSSKFPEFRLPSADLRTLRREMNDFWDPLIKQHIASKASRKASRSELSRFRHP